MSSPDFEALCAEVHSLYQAEIKRQGREERHNDDYYALPEHVKELDRVFVRWHVNRLRPFMHVSKAAEEPSRILNAMVQAADWPEFSSPAMRGRMETAAYHLRVALAAIPINAKGSGE